MADKKIWMGILALALVFGMAVVGCGGDDSSSSEADTWASVTSLTQLNGTWKGSATQRNSNGGITMTMTMEMTMTIIATNATTGTMSGVQKMTYTFSGNIDTATWNSIKESFGGEEGVIINDSARSIIMTDTITSQSIKLTDLTGAQINQNGKKVKQPAGADGEGSPEMIFIKQ